MPSAAPRPTDDYRISLDPADLQMDVIHGFLTTSYWSPGIPRAAVERAAAHSLVVGAYRDGVQVGFARMVTDHTSFGYLADVFVLEPHQGRGLARKMVRALLDLPEVQDFRRILLATRDAHGVYSKLGFEPLAKPEQLMQILRPGRYPR
jgi:GNAT superfamily N-acetyltransferase